MKHPLWLILLILGAELIIILVFISYDWHNEIGKAQWQRDYGFYGNETLSFTSERGNIFYNQIFIESHVKFEVTHFLLPTELEKLKSRGMSSLGDVWFDWIENRLAALFSALENIIQRMSLLLLWWPVWVIILISAITSGYIKLKIGQSNFSYSSPTIHRYGFKSALILFFMAILLIIIPIAIYPWLVPLLISCGCGLLGSVIANRQKKI
ncbi:DUF4400 domain-containing protein [Thorsellia anophelis]|uniref:Integrating conjugative element membrane protein, PFL_4697 family n=1 Tax=Thorsellia anophelis DSM 18579 TaxID=1123402 RepID=A0A1I0DTH7_9GAMM|nr:DUF4400 domain-containing protein [Thorsellia anophelis]SET35741.1 protein of unknown function [Thorsellia anophelis DSM 18579]